MLFSYSIARAARIFFTGCARDMTFQTFKGCTNGYFSRNSYFLAMNLFYWKWFYPLRIIMNSVTQAVAKVIHDTKNYLPQGDCCHFKLRTKKINKSRHKWTGGSVT